MTEDLVINRNLVSDLLDRLTDPDGSVRENAAEALAVMVQDEDWRPDELIRQGGIEVIVDLLEDENPHVPASALDTLFAIAATGHEEDLITAGVIARLDPHVDHPDGAIRKRVQDILWLLSPGVDEAVTMKPQDDY
jgi:HEAT repeat protein